MAEKPPVTSGKETIDCMVCIRGETALFIVSVRRLCLSKLISTDLFSLKKHPTYPFSSSSPSGKCPLFFPLVKRRWELPLCLCGVLLLFLQISTACIRILENPYSSKLTSFPPFFFFFCFGLFVCFILLWSSVFGELRGLPEISRVPSAQSPFLIDCVFDPETGWQLSLTAAWLNAQRSSHCGGQREKSLTSACLVPLTRIRSRRVLTALQNPTTKPNQHANNRVC